MVYRKARGIWAGVLLLAAFGAAGCASQHKRDFADLSYHRLDLESHRTPRVSKPPALPRQAPAQAPADDWARVTGSRPWRYIVVHHSATDHGSAAEFDSAHRARGWDELGYHFVIGNGRGGGDGLVEVGPRWRSQKWGAHCKTPDNEYNDYGIGICLVGDFTRQPPTPAQLASLRRLVGYLAARYCIPPQNVIGHKDADGTRTECPGPALYSYIQGPLRVEVARSLAAR